MNPLERRVGALEGENPETTVVVGSVGDDWSQERMVAEITALALAAGHKPPFEFIFVIPSFGVPVEPELGGVWVRQ